MNDLWSPHIATLAPYIPGEQPQVAGLIKLNTNEHALAPSSGIADVLQSIDLDSLRRYPDPSATALRETIGAVEGLSADCVFVGNGSDEVLGHAFMAFFRGKPPLGILDITYGFYPVWAALYGIDTHIMPVAEDFSVPIGDLMQHRGPIILANPNAPTGIGIKPSVIASIAAANPSRVLLIDEAYFGFGCESCAPLVNSHPNIVVTRTLSKSHALAGLRVGYALAHPAMIEALNRVKDSFNSYPLDVIAQRIAAAAIADTQWLSQASSEIMTQRDALQAGLTECGFDVIPSQANFIFAKHRSLGGRFLFDALREQRILVRRWDRTRIADYLRITVGTAEQNAMLLKALRATIGNTG